MLIALSKKYYLLRFIPLCSLLMLAAYLIQYNQTPQLLANNSPQIELLSQGTSSEVLQTQLVFTLTDKSESHWQWQEVTIKNNTDKAQSFNLNLDKLLNNDSLLFLSWKFPEIVSVPANTSVIFVLNLASDTSHPKLSQMIDQARQVNVSLMLTESDTAKIKHVIPVKLYFTGKQNAS